jgi:hypothetical protein
MDLIIEQTMNFAYLVERASTRFVTRRQTAAFLHRQDAKTAKIAKVSIDHIQDSSETW